MGWLKNPLIWATFGLCSLVAAVAPATVAFVDHHRHVSCAAPKADVAQGTELTSGAAPKMKVLRSDLPRHAVTDPSALTGRTAANGLSAHHCIVEDSLVAPSFVVNIPDPVFIGDAPKANDKVDVLFAPTNGQDSRDGETVEAVMVRSSDVQQHVLVIAVTKSQQSTVLKYMSRSRVEVRKH